MTTNQTIDGVPREQMISFPRELGEDLGELIANKARVCGGGAFEIWEAICEQFGTPAAQPQGELVAHCLLRRNGAGEWVNDAKSWADGVPCREIVAECETHPELYRVRLAYAEQRAPVAVVLPSVAYIHTEHCDTRFNAGWNACLEEVKRLNTK